MNSLFTSKMVNPLRNSNKTGGDCPNFAESSQQNGTVSLSQKVWFEFFNVTRGSWIGIVTTVCLLCLGCGKDYGGRLPISGTITLDGKPMPTGYVIFEPKSGQKMQSGGMIKDGRFEVPVQNGAAPGTYSVAIFSGVTAPVNNFDPGTPEYEQAAMRAPGEQVPSKYNINSILTAEVKVGEPNDFKFDIFTKK